MSRPGAYDNGLRPIVTFEDGHIVPPTTQERSLFGTGLTIVGFPDDYDLWWADDNGLDLSRYRNLGRPWFSQAEFDRLSSATNWAGIFAAASAEDAYGCAATGIFTNAVAQFYSRPFSSLAGAYQTPTGGYFSLVGELEGLAAYTGQPLDWAKIIAGQALPYA